MCRSDGVLRCFQKPSLSSVTPISSYELHTLYPQPRRSIALDLADLAARQGDHETLRWIRKSYDDADEDSDD